MLKKMAKIGQNNPCPCGSGKKFKRCCGSLAQTQSGPKGGDTTTGLPGSARGEQIDTLERASWSGDARAAVRL